MKLNIKLSFIAALLSILMPPVSIAQEGKASFRNGQDMTEYNFPLHGDVKTIECRFIGIVHEAGREYQYPREPVTIEFNKNGDVVLVKPYINSEFDVVSPATLSLMYNYCGQNTEIIETIYYDGTYSDEKYDIKTLYSYDTMGREVKGKRYNAEGKLYRTEEYECSYDQKGNLSKVIYRENGILDWSRSYDANMNIVEFTIYYHDCNVKTTKNTYDENGRLVRSEDYALGKPNELKLHKARIYTYDENGFLMSSECMEYVIDDALKNLYGSADLVVVDRKTYRCDSYGNVIEETYYPHDSSYPQSRIEYRIIYR